MARVFFYNFFDVRGVTLEGLKTIDSEELKNRIDERLQDKYFGYLPRKNNLFFLNLDNLKAEILSQYPILESLEIEKKLPHELILKFKERAALGIWCFTNSECVYFDSELNIWGSAAKSTGFLIVTIHDQRDSKEEIDKEYFDAVKPLLNNSKLPVTIKDVTIPAKSFRNFQINTAEGYYVLMSLDSNIADQIQALGIFLEDQDAGFNPLYIDLRINGRVYYK